MYAMSNVREQMLERVRRAVNEGNRAVTPVPLPPRGTVGYQGGGPDPVARFGEELQKAGGDFYRVSDRAETVSVVLSILERKQAGPVVIARGPFIDQTGLADALRRAGLDPILMDSLTVGAEQIALF